MQVHSGEEQLLAGQRDLVGDADVADVPARAGGADRLHHRLLGAHRLDHAVRPEAAGELLDRGVAGVAALLDDGRDPHDRGLQDLVGERSTRSETFGRLWGAHDVRTHGTGTRRFRHPEVGELVLAYEELAITAEPGLILMVYTAEPGSASAERLRILASLAAEQETVGQ